ncbi:MAG: hypothetical protein JJU00_18060 [Opitutales bacterium]|nr:hypothetical protein [Opitutales bacterium]
MNQRAPTGSYTAAWFRATVSTALALALTACAGTGTDPAPTAAEPAGPPETVLLDVHTLGALVWFDPARGHGVMRLYTSGPVRAGTEVETRDDAFRITARWEVTPLRYGESIGLRWIEGSGSPAVGEAVTFSPRTDPDGPDPGS